MSSLNIVFFGTPDFAVPVLNALLDNGYNVSGVFSGRGPISDLAREYGIRVFQPISLKKAKPRSDAQSASTTGDEQTFEAFKLLKPDFCIVAAYGKILPARYLDVPEHGFINIHPSLLPKYRGPSPIQTAILNGDKETGATIMVVDEETDHGPILDSVKYQIPNTKANVEISQELFELGAKLLVQTLPKYLNGEIKPKEQDHSQATFTKMFTRENSRINWNSSAEKIYNQIRALNPEPGTWTTWNPSTSSGQAGKVINISNVTTRRVGYPQRTDLGPGTVKKVDNKIAVATSKGYLDLISVQLEGGKEMDAADFVNGHSNFLNSQLE